MPEICTHALERTTSKYVHPGSPTWRRLAARRAQLVRIEFAYMKSGLKNCDAEKRKYAHD